MGRRPSARVLGLALVSVVRALAREGPLLVALDDVQWVDASSAEVLRFMLRRLEGQPVGVLATVRGRPVEAPLELDRAFAAFERLTVEPLSVGAIHRLLWGRLSLNLPRPALLRVHETAGGNPFFALELGRALVDGTIREDSGHIALPESLQSVVAERLDTLPARVRETLVAVAALAAPTVTLLEALAPAVVDDIERAQSRGVLELDGDRIRFTHPLFAPACYSAMPLHRRRRLHRRLAELDVDLEERARHLAIAATGPDEEVALALDAAAAHARARGAALAAAELAELAVALTPADAVGRDQSAPHHRSRALHVGRRHGKSLRRCSRMPSAPRRRAPFEPRRSVGSRGCARKPRVPRGREPLQPRARRARPRDPRAGRHPRPACVDGRRRARQPGRHSVRGGGTAARGAAGRPGAARSQPRNVRRADVLAYRPHPSGPARTVRSTSNEPPAATGTRAPTLARLLALANRFEEARAHLDGVDRGTSASEPIPASSGT